METFICEMQYNDDVQNIMRSARVVHHSYNNIYVVTQSKCSSSSLMYDCNEVICHDEISAIKVCFKFVYSHLYGNDKNNIQTS